MRLGAFLQGAGQHIAAWRFPGQVIDGNTNFEFHKRLAQSAERGLFDLYFFADGLAPDFSGGRDGGSSKFAGFEPVTLCSALAPFTRHLGLVATCTTTYEEPFNTARKFASLDLISGGRAGWNVVTSTGDLAAKNFNLDEQLPHATRYRRACEFVDVVQKLWDSWEDDALVRDRQSGYFYDPSKVHRADHVGEHFKVRGPLNVPRSPQGRPVLVQAGQSQDGRDLAASIAEAIFTAHQHLGTAQEFSRDVKSRAAKFGRNPDHVLVMPGLAPYVGKTEEEARAKYERLNSLIAEEDGLMFLSQILGSSVDLRKYDLDGPLPPITINEGTKSRQELLIRTAKENNFSIRQLYQWIATGRGHLTVIGTPEKIADVMQEWFEKGGADGFNILPAWVPGGLDDFVELVTPELQRRGLFRTEYEGSTLRENLGLDYPINRWAAARPAARPGK